MQKLFILIVFLNTFAHYEVFSSDNIDLRDWKNKCVWPQDLPPSAFDTEVIDDNPTFTLTSIVLKEKYSKAERNPALFYVPNWFPEMNWIKSNSDYMYCLQSYTKAINKDNYIAALMLLNEEYTNKRFRSISLNVNNMEYDLGTLLYDVKQFLLNNIPSSSHIICIKEKRNKNDKSTENLQIVRYQKKYDVKQFLLNKIPSSSHIVCTKEKRNKNGESTKNMQIVLYQEKEEYTNKRLRPISLSANTMKYDLGTLLYDVKQFLLNKIPSNSHIICTKEKRNKNDKSTENLQIVRYQEKIEPINLHKYTSIRKLLSRLEEETTKWKCLMLGNVSFKLRKDHYDKKDKN